MIELNHYRIKTGSYLECLDEIPDDDFNNNSKCHNP